MRWRIGRQHEIPELDAGEDVARVYHESRGILRLSGVDDMLRQLAASSSSSPNEVDASLLTLMPALHTA
ncbi:MAG: hypothetical protein ABJD11_04735 [Gemmatimonadota bacterium]